MSKTELTALEVQNSLNGFDEIAIEKHMGTDLVEMVNANKMSTFMRSLIFVHLRHQGLSDVDAKQGAMEVTLGDLESYFADEPEEIFEDEPESDPGKESTAPDSEQI